MKLADCPISCASHSFSGVTDSPVSATPMSNVVLNGCMPDVLVSLLETTRDTSYALEGGSRI